VHTYNFATTCHKLAIDFLLVYSYNVIGASMLWTYAVSVRE